MSNTWKEFLSWEKASKDTIDFKTMYVDIVGKRGIVGNRKNKKGEIENGDIVSGLFLSQIVYWYLPSKSGASKLRVKKHGHYWIVKKPDEWYEEIRLTSANYRTATKRLEDENLIVVKAMKDPFDENKQKNVTHIRLNIPEFMKRWNLIMKSIEDQLVENDSDIDQYYQEQMEEAAKMSAEALSHMEIVESTISENVDSTISNENVESTISNENVESTIPLYTESTTKITTKNTNKESIYLNEVNKLEIPSKTVEVLKPLIDRMILLDINPVEIELVFHEYKDKVDHSVFNSVLYSVITTAKGFDVSFKSYLAASIEERLKNAAKKSESARSSSARVESSYDDATDYDQIDYLKGRKTSAADQAPAAADLELLKFKMDFQRDQLTAEEVQLLKDAGEWKE